ncbi:MAG: NAD(P)-dependent oxidoreductase [Actinobacteria bacterium]|nr:NAD(P)-dependent oxidoreductase [Actinomycetota bacterium]
MGRSVTPSPAVGFVGLGQIGAPMAGHLVDWPGGLVVCDVRPEAVAPFEAKGARVGTTPAETGEQAGVICVMVRDDDQVREAVAGADGLLRTADSGSVIAIHSTIRPETAEELAELGARSGVAVVDAPVTGGFVGAHAGTLAVMVGGPEDAVDRCRAPFECFADLVVRTGPVGSGTRAKLARNLLGFVAFAAAGEAARLAEAAGVDLGLLGQVVRHSDAVTGGPGAILLRDATAPMAAGDDWYETLAHVRGLGEKDLALALALGSSLGVELPLARLALEHLGAALGVPHDREGGDG